MNNIIFLILFFAPTTWCNIWDILQHRKVKSPTAAGCTLSLVKDYPNEPIMVNDQYKLIYPTSKDSTTNILTLTIGDKEKITIACLGKNNEIVNKNPKHNFGQRIQLACSAGHLKMGSTDYTQYVNSLNCTMMVENTVKNSAPTDICGGANALKTCGDPKRKNPTVSLDVGFDIDNHLIKQYCVCFDKTTKYPVFTHYVVNPSDMKYSVAAKSTIRPQFTEDTTYGFTCDNLYKDQQKTINGLLNISPSSKKYIDPQNGNGIELNRGHLVPNSGFVYATQKKATFHYINAAPQWHYFNAGNWAAVELAVRARAQDTVEGFDVYTGVSGSEPAQILGKDLYLNVVKPYNTVPVPQFYWKLVHDPKAHQAVVFVGHNNPHDLPFDSNNINFCTDVTTQISWVKLQSPSSGNTTKDAGFIAICQYDVKIKKHFPDMPQTLDASGGIIKDPVPISTSKSTFTTVPVPIEV